MDNFHNIDANAPDFEGLDRKFEELVKQKRRAANPDVNANNSPSVAKSSEQAKTTQVKPKPKPKPRPTQPELSSDKQTKTPARRTVKPSISAKKVADQEIAVRNGSRGKRQYGFPNRGYGEAVKQVGRGAEAHLDKAETYRTSVRVPEVLLTYAKSAWLAMAGLDPQTNITNNKFLIAMCLSFVDNPDHRNVLKELYLYDTASHVRSREDLESRKNDRYGKLLDVMRNEGGQRQLTPEQAVVQNNQALRTIQDQLTQQNENHSLDFHDLMASTYALNALIGWIFAERSALLDQNDYPKQREDIPGAMNSELVRSIIRQSQQNGSEYYHSHDARRRQDQF